MWQHNGNKRPDFATEPEPGQESVWDYPRPPALKSSSQRIEVKTGREIIAVSSGCMRVLETASPPTFYIPPGAINMVLLTPTSGASFCEWKGAARYWALKSFPDEPAIGWSYPDPSHRFAAIRDWLCFYPGRIGCYVDGEAVQAQAGGFYGGWITSNVVGPFKGDPRTTHW